MQFNVLLYILIKLLIINIIILNINGGNNKKERNKNIKNTNNDLNYHEINILCIGDSITKGSGASNRNITSYPSLLKQYLDILSKSEVLLPNQSNYRRLLDNNNDFYTIFNVYNYGVGKTTIIKNSSLTYWNTNEYHNIIKNKINIDIVIIMFGTNDAKFDIWNQHKYTVDYKSFIKKILSLKNKRFSYSYSNNFSNKKDNDLLYLINNIFNDKQINKKYKLLNVSRDDIPIVSEVMRYNKMKLTNHPIIYLCSPPPIYINGFYNIQQSTINEISHILLELSYNLSVNYINIYESLGGKKLLKEYAFIDPSLPVEWPNDGVHPNDYGYIEMAHVIMTALFGSKISHEIRNKLKMVNKLFYQLKLNEHLIIEKIKMKNKKVRDELIL